MKNDCFVFFLCLPHNRNVQTSLFAKKITKFESLGWPLKESYEPVTKHCTLNLNINIYVEATPYSIQMILLVIETKLNAHTTCW